MTDVPAIHPLAMRVPEMSADEFAALRDDIAREGLHVPIVLYGGLVLDGRHRLAACAETDTEPRYSEYEGDSPASYVVSMNARRRSLTAGQIAALGVEFLPEMEAEYARNKGVRTDLGTSGSKEIEVPGQVAPGPNRSARQVAAITGSSEASIKRAKYVKENDSEMFERVKSGEMPVTRAEKIVRDREVAPRPALAVVPDPPAETGKRSAAAVERIAGQVDALREAITALNVPKSCEAVGEAQRATLAQTIRSAAKAFNALALSLERAASERVVA